MFSVSHFTSHSLLRLLPESYFKKSTFQPNFLCSSSFKTNCITFYVKITLPEKILDWCQIVVIIFQLTWNFIYRQIIFDSGKN